MWRIVKIENDQLVLIYNEKGNRVVWDDRFNTERNRTDGINDYSVSRIYDNLTDIYKNDTIFNKNTRNLLAIHNIYIGKRSESDMYNDGSIEKSSLLENLTKLLGFSPRYTNSPFKSYKPSPLYTLVSFSLI